MYDAGYDAVMHWSKVYEAADRQGTLGSRRSPTDMLMNRNFIRKKRYISGP